MVVKAGKKGFFDLLSESVDEFVGKMWSFMKVYLLLYLLPLVIISAVALIVLLIMMSTVSFEDVTNEGFVPLITGMATNGGTDAMLSSSFSVLFVILFIVLFAAFIILNLVMVLAYYRISLSKEDDVSIRDAVGEGSKYFWKFLGLVIVEGFLLILLFMLFIIPGIIFFVFWLFSVYVLMNENTGIWESLKRSKQLVKGNGWRMFGYLLLFGILMALFLGVVQFVPVLGSLFANFVLTAFSIVFFKNVYLDLKGSSQ